MGWIKSICFGFKVVFGPKVKVSPTAGVELSDEVIERMRAAIDNPKPDWDGSFPENKKEN